MDTIREVLSLDRFPDFVVGSSGYAAKRRIDIAPLAYEIVVNRPLDEGAVNRMIEFGGSADKLLVERLFGLCNGIRIGATKFLVYGVVGKIDRGSGDVAYAVPLDINVPNIYGRPENWPDEYLIVASSREMGADQVRRKLIHAITSDGKILVGDSDFSNGVLRHYTEVDQWLVSEVDRALQDEAHY